MNYKAILTILDNTKPCEDRTRFAIDLAKQHGAKLTGIAPVEIASTLFIGDFMSANSKMIDELQHSIEADATKAQVRFDEMCTESGIESFDHKTVRGSANDAINSEATATDLIVLSQHFEDTSTTVNTKGVVEHTLMVSARPVLIIPAIGAYKSPPKNVLIGWRDSRECSHAIRQALPFLQNADAVEIVEVLPKSNSKGINDSRRASVLNYLSLHNVDAKFSTQKSDSDPGNVLLSYACDVGADLLVMGGYGHTRLREWAVGGATKTILESMTLPVMMAH